MSNEGPVSYHVADEVGYLTLHRPGAHNAMTKAIYAEIRDICRSVRVDKAVRVLVVRGAGGAFSAGGDLKEILAALEGGDPADILRYDEVLPFEALRSLPKPAVAVVDGLCMGGGLTLALLCDIRIASSGSRFAMPEARVGIVDGHLPRLLRERVPAARLRYWLYTGATFGADEAYDAGLLTKVVDADALDPAVAKVLADLRASSPAAIARLKAILTETWSVPGMEDAYDTLLGGDARGRLAGFAAGKR
jgi:enoyl-CoA hydratase